MTPENNEGVQDLEEEMDTELDLNNEESFNSNNDSNGFSGKLNELSKRFRSSLPSILTNQEGEEGSFEEKNEDQSPNNDEIEVIDDVPKIYEDMEILRESLENKIDKEVELLDEEIDEAIDDSDDKISKAEERLNKKIEETEKELVKEIAYIKDDIESIESEMERLVEAVNSKVDKTTYEKDVKKEVSEIEKGLEAKADTSKVQDMQQVQSALTHELEDKIDEHDIESNSDNLKENLGLMKKELEKLENEEDSDPISPSDVDEDMKGNYVEVEGKLLFKKAVDGDYLYSLKGDDAEVPVKSKNKISKDESVVKGSVKTVDGFLFIESMHV